METSTEWLRKESEYFPGPLLFLLAHYAPTAADLAPTAGKVQGPSPTDPEVQPQRQTSQQVVQSLISQEELESTSSQDSWWANPKNLVAIDLAIQRRLEYSKEVSDIQIFSLGFTPTPLDGGKYSWDNVANIDVHYTPQEDDQQPVEQGHQEVAAKKNDKEKTVAIEVEVLAPMQQQIHSSKVTNVEVPAPVKVCTEQVAQQQADVEVPFPVRVSTEQVSQQQAAATTTRVSSGADPATATAAATVHKQAVEPIKEAEATEVKKYESRKVAKGKAAAPQVQAQKEVARRATKMSGSMKYLFRSRQVNISQPYTANKRDCKRWVFESKDPVEFDYGFSIWGESYDDVPADVLEAKTICGI
nr:hypothetical protein Iba_chr02dCG4340 [Ipomoea batatas]